MKVSYNNKLTPSLQNFWKSLSRHSQETKLRKMCEQQHLFLGLRILSAASSLMESIPAMSSSSWNTTDTRGILSSETSRPLNYIIVLLPDPGQGDVVVEDVHAVHDNLLRVNHPRLVDVEAARGDYSQRVPLGFEASDFHSKI